MGERGSGDLRPMRRKLGDDAGNLTYIFTEPRVGYRMPKGGDATGGQMTAGIVSVWSPERTRDVPHPQTYAAVPEFPCYDCL